jgi:hypothetical protein
VVSHAQLAALEGVLARGFAQLDPSTMGCEETDLGTLVSIAYREHRLDYFDLCDRVPPEAHALLRRIVLALGLASWLDAR